MSFCGKSYDGAICSHFISNVGKCAETFYLLIVYFITIY